MGASAIPYAAMAVSAYLASKNQPQMPNVPAVAPPQAAKAPNVQGIVGGLQGQGQGGGPGLAQTFLTGPSGVDPNALKLGKPTLLGQ